MDKYKVIAMRFLRAFLSGAASTAILITITNISTWGDLRTALSAILLSIIVGGINGILLAADKLVRWEE